MGGDGREEAKRLRAKQYDPGGSYVTDSQLQGMLHMNGRLQPSTHHTFDMVYEIRALRAELAAAREENRVQREALDHLANELEGIVVPSFGVNHVTRSYLAQLVAVAKDPKELVGALARPGEEK